MNSRNVKNEDRPDSIYLPRSVSDAGVHCKEGTNEIKTEVKIEEICDDSSSNEMCKVNLPSVDSIPKCSTLDNVDFAYLHTFIVPVAEKYALQKHCEIKIEDNVENSMKIGATSDVLLQNESQDINSKKVCIFMYIIIVNILML